MARQGDERGITLLLKEMGLDRSLYISAQDREKAAGLIMGMTFVRFDARFREQLKGQLKAYAFSNTLAGRSQLSAAPVGQAADALSLQRLALALLFVVDRVTADPEAYPFSLSQVEFATFATELFGGEVQNVESTYHPPSYYVDAAKLAVAVIAGAVMGTIATVILPEALATGAAVARFAPQLAKAAGSGIGGKAASSMMPADLLGDYRKRTLWPIYRTELERRRLH